LAVADAAGDGGGNGRVGASDGAGADASEGDRAAVGGCILHAVDVHRTMNDRLQVMWSTRVGCSSTLAPPPLTATATTVLIGAACGASSSTSGGGAQGVQGVDASTGKLGECFAIGEVGAIASGTQGHWAAVLSVPPSLVLLTTNMTTNGKPRVANLTFATRFGGKIGAAPTLAVAQLGAPSSSTHTLPADPDARASTGTQAGGHANTEARGNTPAEAGPRSKAAAPTADAADLLLVVVEKVGGVLAVAAVDGSNGAALWQSTLPLNGGSSKATSITQLVASTNDPTNPRLVLGMNLTVVALGI
jgi:hypothetical protein